MLPGDRNWSPDESFNSLKVKGQSWKAEVTANDGYGDSIPYNTSELCIDDVTLTVESVEPINNSKFNNTNYINFTWNVDEGGLVDGIQNCSLYLDYNIVNET